MASDDDIPLPAEPRAAWGRRARPTKGPKPGLSLERIVAAAVARRRRPRASAPSRWAAWRASSGSSPMSLYRYVGAKDELLALMVDAALGARPPRRRGRGLARRPHALGVGATTTRCGGTRGCCASRSAARR